MSATPKPETDSAAHMAGWLGALFLVILGAKLWLIQIYGTAIPYMDQWDELGRFFKPWVEGRLTWGAWFEPHNEHRIFFTRALDLFSTWLNGQWDPTLQMVIAAMLHAGYASGFALCLWLFIGKKHGALICVLPVPFFALPFAAENTLHGFQSSMYFLSIFSLITILGLGFGKPGSGRWICGLGAAVMSLFTMGSGLLASLAVIGLVILRTFKSKRITREAMITVGGAAVVFAAGLALHVKVASDKQYQAYDHLAFLDALMRNLAWPFWDWPGMLFLICLPLIIILVKYFQSNLADFRAAEFVLTLAFWGFLQAAGLAYARTVLGHSSRYMDTLCTIPMASAAGWFILGQKIDFQRWPQRIMATAWALILFFGLYETASSTMKDYTLGNRKGGLLQEENVRAFVSTDNPACLSNLPSSEIPYPTSGRLIELLRDPKLQAIMPPACRPGLKLEPQEPAGAAFVRDGFPLEIPGQTWAQAWGSYATNGPEATGFFVSKPLSATLPRLIIPVGLAPNADGLSVKLIDAAGSRVELPVTTVGRWQTLIVNTPKSPFRVEIADQSRQSWVAVGEIKELGWLGYDALRLLSHAVGILVIGLGLIIFLSGRALISRPARGGFAEILILVAGLAVMGWVGSARDVSAMQLTDDLHKDRAVYFAAHNNIPGAERQLRDALWLQPDDPKTLVTLAGYVRQDPTLEKKSARKLAVAYYEAAIRLKPDDAEARANLDRLLSANGDAGK